MPLTTLPESCRHQGLRWMGTGQENPLWTAHYGAAHIAAWYFVQQTEPDSDCVEALAEQLERMSLQHADNFPDQLDTTPCDDPSIDIIDASEEHIDGLHAIGHNVIYLAYGLRVLKDCPELHIRGVRDSWSGFNE